jgi:hypothetical protein
MTGQPIPPYTEQDERAAREAVEQWRDRPIRSRVGTHELDDLVREVAGAIATARTEGRRPFDELFGGGPDTSCRTTYRESPNLAGEPPFMIECVEVPIDELRDAFGDSL